MGLPDNKKIRDLKWSNIANRCSRLHRDYKKPEGRSHSKTMPELHMKINRRKYKLYNYYYKCV